MKTITLGASGIQSSIMGLGCMGMSEFYGERDDVQSRATLERAFELGVTHFDTSNVYGRGHNEQLVGDFIRDKRDGVMLASKFGVVRDPGGTQGSTYDRDIDNSPAYMRQCCEESLARLGTDVIDLYYVHRAAPGIPIEDTVGALSRLVEEGKIRGIGLSEIDGDTLRRAHATHPIAALQSEYSLWTREAERDVLPICRELNITFVAYSPLGRGFLTGAIQKADDLAKDDFRLTSPRFQGDNFDRNLAIVAHVNDLAQRKGCTAGQIAIAWLLHQDRDIVPIPGTKRIKYLEENVAASQVALDPSDLATLEALLPIGGAAGSRYDPNFKGNPEAVKP
ncbi:aldo/keto reductase [Sphingosinicella microcystinivorans]|uniref:Oxidoreductase n=1 Tax=Sphingosinicella microcystinivorans TaxID=335406 RepID=A0AAD1D8R1_SPHMI|nr:aldo/keto reductase [Sphingosinicella microcystinivorans]RKS86329.1 aryl-alcohol dehydrogenase-like predicted oxidoreductase [Sphingosinicella microcystinivorans]BBE35625.1 oxidoreductase [Sphingosinicella microcystinivorans]